jgi:uncharacterized protein YeaO (DUF488 family)
MAISVVMLGSDRRPNEGIRVGTVRRPPRGVPKSEFASQNWYRKHPRQVDNATVEFSSFSSRLRKEAGGIRPRESWRGKHVRPSCLEGCRGE